VTADPLALAARVAHIFRDLGVRYLLGGSFASTTFGEPRATLDIDFVADLRPEQVTLLVAALGAEFHADAEWITEEVRQHRSFQVVHRPTMLRVDVFVPQWTGLHLWKWEQRRQVTLPVADSAVVDVTSPEGIVLQKLLWFRSGGGVSDRQWRDVLGVLKAQRLTLDRAALSHWARELGIDDLLARAAAAAGLDPP
jgi:hypothetical protein